MYAFGRIPYSAFRRTAESPEVEVELSVSVSGQTYQAREQARLQEGAGRNPDQYQVEVHIMTPAEAAECIGWWREGLRLKDIAARLGIPPSTVSSRAAALRRQGVALDKRPQGGPIPVSRPRPSMGAERERGCLV
jgi:hypothetical protein